MRIVVLSDIRGALIAGFRPTVERPLFDGAVALEFRRVPFDLGAWLAILEGSGRPHVEKALAAYRAGA